MSDKPTTEQLRGDYLMGKTSTTGEWTPENICEAAGFVSQVEPEFYTSLGELIRRICDVHNAALAAERIDWTELRDLLGLPSTDSDKALVIQEIKQLREQLAERAELAQVTTLPSAANFTWGEVLQEEIQQLKDQLAAANDALSSMTEHHANFGVRQERDEVLKQLAAEREKCEKLMTDGISERNWSNHLRIQLAAEVEKVNKLQQQLAAAVEALKEMRGYDADRVDRWLAKMEGKHE